MTIAVDPLALIAGTAGVPLVANAIGRAFITPGPIASQADADAALKRLVRNFGIFNLLLAGGLGYAATQGSLEERTRSAALGGAVGTGILGTLLLAALMTAPKPEEQGAPVRAQLPAGVAQPRNVAARTSNLVGF